MVEKPWRVLRERAEIEFIACDLPAGVRAIHATRGEDRAILVNRNLSPAERLAALAHELKHDDAGGGCHRAGVPPLLRVISQREEARVDRAVALELLDQAALATWVEQRSELGMVLARDVAEEFDVAIGVADLALQQLAAGF